MSAPRCFRCNLIDLLQAAQWLGTRVDFLVITANGPHIQPQIEQASGRKC
jgi:hypothetical protein